MLFLCSIVDLGRSLGGTRLHDFPFCSLTPTPLDHLSGCVLFTCHLPRLLPGYMYLPR